MASGPWCDMSEVRPGPPGFPRVEGQASNIFYGSPVAIIGVFVEVVRSRFRGENDDTGYRWSPDPTPPTSADGAADTPTALYIESEYADNPEGRDTYPAVIVRKGRTVPSSMMIGDRIGIHRPTREEWFHAQAPIPIEATCQSTVPLESAIIGDLVWFHILAAKNYIREAFGIHSISLPELGETRKSKKNSLGSDVWETPVSFTITVDFRWSTRPIAPVLSQITADLRNRGGGSETFGAISVHERPSSSR